MKFDALEFNTTSSYNCYSIYFCESSTVTLAQAGIYQGPEDIKEYFWYADTFNLLFLESTLMSELSFVPCLDKDTGVCECEFLYFLTSSYELDQAVSGGKAFNVRVMLKISLDLNDNKVSSLNAYYTDFFLAMFFANLSSTTSTSLTFCVFGVFGCTEVHELNGSPTLEECIASLEALHATSDGPYVDGDSFSCRNLHSGFALNNPKHCPHISFIPLEDENGLIKCQTSQQMLVSNLFSADNIQAFTEYATLPTSLIGSVTAGGRFLPAISSSASSSTHSSSTSSTYYNVACDFGTSASSQLLAQLCLFKPVAARQT
jgi:hypothetical protein